ncbi:MAG: hypothetical protein HYW63_04260 [Candidatus Levybacteria bacterium]|nr:hypothetical protein [Candidatus Levybacteria bacterium]
MAEVTGIAPPTREAERPLTGFTRTEANSYRTKAINNLTVDSTQGEWHSVKGGLRPDQDRSRTPSEYISYGVLFNPQTRTWLKVVPPEVTDTPDQEKLEKTLRRSVDQQRAALQVAGLPDLASQIREVEVVDMDGKKVYGFTSPHIGPSLEYILYKTTKSWRGRVKNPDAADFFSQVYSMAADQAERLYLEFGIWTSDPSPGNILLRQDENGIHVVLIDFSNRLQEYEYLYQRVSKERYGPEGYINKIKSLLQTNVRQLHRRFYQYCEKRGIPFIRDPQEIETNIDNSVAVVNARKSLQEATTAPSTSHE